MDTLTHALSGALLARATAPVTITPTNLAPGPRMAAGFAAAAFPDCDFALRLLDTLTYLNLHRGITHSIVLLPVWAFGLSLLFSAFTRGRVNWRAFYGVAALAIGIHIAGDVITSYGTMILIPLSHMKIAIPLVFIIDPWFTGIIVIGVLASRGERRYPAIIALACLLAYLVMQAFLRDQARAIGEAHALERGISDSIVHALPQPLSPFNWMIVVSSPGTHDQAFVNLLRTKEQVAGDWLLSRISSGYAPRSSQEWTRWPRTSNDDLAHEAWNDPALDAFRRFAEIPALLEVEVKNGGQCVWFVDLRFTLPAVAPSFVYGACREGAAPWRLARRQGQFLVD